MTDQSDLNALVQLSSARPTVRTLACPECAAAVRLRGDLDPGIVIGDGDNLYRCVACLSEFRQLAELVAV